VQRKLPSAILAAALLLTIDTGLGASASAVARAASDADEGGQPSSLRPFGTLQEQA
jgi:hypothetical protein